MTVARRLAIATIGFRGGIGGGGGPTQLVVIEALLDADVHDVEVSVESFAAEVEVEPAIEVTIEDQVEIDAEVDRTETIQ